MQLRPDKQEAQKLWQSRHMERTEPNTKSDVWDGAGREGVQRYVTMPAQKLCAKNIPAFRGLCGGVRVDEAAELKKPREMGCPVRIELRPPHYQWGALPLSYGSIAKEGSEYPINGPMSSHWADLAGKRVAALSITHDERPEGRRRPVRRSEGRCRAGRTAAGGAPGRSSGVSRRRAANECGACSTDSAGIVPAEVQGLGRQSSADGQGWGMDRIRIVGTLLNGTNRRSPAPRT